MRQKVLHTVNKKQLTFKTMNNGQSSVHRKLSRRERESNVILEKMLLLFCNNVFQPFLCHPPLAFFFIKVVHPMEMGENYFRTSLAHISPFISITYSKFCYHESQGYS